MNKNEVNPELENGEESQSYPGDEFDDDDYRLELEIASRSKYSGRWAAEKWLLHRCIRRCLNFLTGSFRTVKATEEDPDDLF